jgi:hypothetical protein
MFALKWLLLEWLSATTEDGGDERIATGEWSNDKNVGVAISHDEKWRGGAMSDEGFSRSHRR